MSLLAKLKELIRKSVITDQKIDNVMKRENEKTEELIHRMFNLIQEYGPMFKKEGKTYELGLYGLTYFIINKILIPKIELFCQKFNIDYDLNRSGGKIYLRELGAVIHLVTMENPEKIRGYETADAMIDKLDVLKIDKAEEVLEIVLSRNTLKKPDGEPNICGVTTLNSFIELDVLTMSKAKEALAIRNKFKKTDGKPNTYRVTTLSYFIENGIRK